MHAAVRLAHIPVLQAKVKLISRYRLQGCSCLNDMVGNSFLVCYLLNGENAVMYYSNSLPQGNVPHALACVVTVQVTFWKPQGPAGRMTPSTDQCPLVLYHFVMRTFCVQPLSQQVNRVKSEYFLSMALSANY